MSFTHTTTEDDVRAKMGMEETRRSTAELAAANVIFTESAHAELNEIGESFLNIPFCPWTPNDGAQSRFLLDLGPEALYGGAAGGGKSIAIMMAASQFLNVPGYAALLLRKSYQDLGKPGALMDIAETWWRGQPGVRFDPQQHTYTFRLPDGGKSKIVFGALDNENDRFKYQGGAYHFIGWDELTQQKERDYLYVSFSRGRRTTDGILSQIPLRIRSTTNPGGVGHEWVHQRFIARWEAWKLRNGDRPEKNFHPAMIDDNPKLDREAYVQSLMELDPVTRGQLLRGDWNIRPDGRMFKRSWFKVADRSEVPGNCVWVRFWDTAATDPSPGRDPDYTVGIRVGRDIHGNFWIDDMRRWRAGPSESDTWMRMTATADTRRVNEAMEQDPGAAGKITIHHYRIHAFPGSNFRGVLAAGKSRGRVTMVAAGRKTPLPKILAAGPLASHAEAGLVHFVSDGSWDVDAFLNEIEIFPDGEHDDIVDALSGAINLLAKMPSWGLRFEDANEEFRKENEWRPELLDWNPNGIVGLDNDRISIETKSAAQVQAEIERDTMAAFSMD